jgi:hypothetical protein
MIFLAFERIKKEKPYIFAYFSYFCAPNKRALLFSKPKIRLMPSWFDAIKNNFFQRDQRKQAAAVGNLRRQLLRSDAAQNIGILYDATTTATRHLVWDFAKKISAADKKIALLGFVDLPEMPQDLPSEASQYLPAGTHFFFCRKDLNWTKSPQGANIQFFSHETFDWLLCLYPQEQPQLDFVAAASAAKARIARFRSEQTDIFDVMIATQSDSLPDLLQDTYQILYR